MTPIGGGDRVCYEEVVLAVRGDAAAHLAGIVTPLLIHDLPTHVWWPGDPPFRDPVFEQLVELSDRVIVDSADFGDLLAGLRRLANLRRQSGVGDLAWERLSWWQELTAQFFDAPRFRRYLPNLSRLAHPVRRAPSASRPRHEDADEVSPGVASPMAEALLYAGWIATRLGWKRHRTLRPLADGGFALRLEGKHEMVDLLVEPEPTDDVRPGELLSVRPAVARRDRGGRIHHRSRRRRRHGCHERRWNDRPAAARQHGHGPRAGAAQRRS